MGRRSSIYISITHCNISLVVAANETAGVMILPEEGVAHLSENAQDVGDWTYDGMLKSAIQQSVARIAKGQTAALTGTRVSSAEAVDLLVEKNSISVWLKWWRGQVRGVDVQRSPRAVFVKVF
jgi:hypothetical protein